MADFLNSAMVSEAFTNQKCSQGGKKGSMNSGKLKCNNYGFEINVDVDGAKNIVSRALGKPENSEAFMEPVSC
ncbi:hypothetical protein AKJ50_01510 [candidate division MSBL1 archaeon SCGC-AAA382A13]|uniref:Cas12f1-like TNB domain-containing protein n=1 Tax=candidate division MSBL1 archaeon SCGC-AAA382A13 TaxID=1698279 RepID=A0A133VFL8_9EURY|nr:hypothetical protein AKJ50_01510 [candidate division MSBL1 archaeon SCGC-AAA382A13]